MDTKALKQKILDLAIRGKLVPQDPNDEPASVLLEKIRAEKQQMVKDGMLKSKDLKNDTVIFVGEDNLHYEKFSDGTIKCLKDETKFFKIPKSWSFVRIRDIASVKGGKRIPKGKEFSAVPTPHAYIRVTNMKNRTITTSDLKYISDEIYETIRNYTISKTDLYLTIAGTIGLVGEVPDLLDGMNLTENAVKVTPFSINKTFLCFCLLSCFVQNQFQDKTHQVAQPKLAIERILNTIIPLPPLNEQILITNSVKTAFDLVDCVEKQNIALGEIITKTKSKILDLAIRGKLIPQDPNDEPASVLLERIHQEKEGLIKAGKLKRDKRESVIFRGEDNSYYEIIGTQKTCIDNEIHYDIPNGWVVDRLKNVYAINPKNDIANDETIVSFVPMCLINEQFSCNCTYELKPWKNCKKGFTHFADGDLGFAKISPCFENRKSVIFSNLKNGYGAGTTELHILRNFCEGIIPQYTILFLKSASFIERGVSTYSGTVGQQRIDKNVVMDAIIPIPPQNEQIRIADRVKQLFSILDSIQATIV